jgi:hypothetical protein
MSRLLIRKLNNTPLKASELSAFLDKEEITCHSISYANWSEYPYKPDVRFRIAHNGTNIFLNYKIEESDIKAVCNYDNGKVWEDSCLEFFISFTDGFYYNIECNCIGKMAVATGSDRHNRIPVPPSIIKHIARWSSLGSLPFENKSGKWELSLIIPIDVFYLNELSAFDALQGKGNFYKCGDNLQTPHFLSWHPIESATPNFHLPVFFGELLFE